ncbi:MAG: SUMF1/EgtB/PvdO family nonheme iron enzyme [Saprospiraceae bacterium]|nr:SUMF1/EgtB/PvdO family nonheme iron enzyme [Saprospiraceae bacterium]
MKRRSIISFIMCCFIITTAPIIAQIRTTPTPEARPQSRGQILAAIADSMVFIQGGTFIMGCLDDRDIDCEFAMNPSKAVTLHDFYLSSTEVTQAQWQAVMGDNLFYFRNCPFCPAEYVSWEDVQAFLKKLNTLTSQAPGQGYRLPTEAEWEYAARGGNASKGTKFPGSNDPDEVAWYGKNSGDTTHPVGRKKANELGLYDMGGNVSEWCSDCLIHPQTEDYEFYGVRGGNWFGPHPMSVSSGARSCDSKTFHCNVIGFRLAKSIY